MLQKYILGSMAGDALPPLLRLTSYFRSQENINGCRSGSVRNGFVRTKSVDPLSELELEISNNSSVNKRTRTVVQRIRCNFSFDLLLIRLFVIYFFFV